MNDQVYVTIEQPQPVFNQCCVCSTHISAFVQGMCDNCQGDFYRDLTPQERQTYDYVYPNNDPLGLFIFEKVARQ